MAVWVFKSPLVDDMRGAELAGFLAKMQAVISSQSAVAVGENEDITRIFEGTPNGLKDLFDFVFENLAGLARTPKSRLMGQSQGVITAGQFDLISYYDSIAKFQELEGRPVIEKVIDLVVRETEGDIYKTLGGDGVSTLDWEFDFNPLYRIGPVEQADIELKQAQRDQIYIANSVLGPSEVRKERFGDLLEPFAKWENQPLNMETPAIVEKSKEAEGAPVKGPLAVGNQDKSNSGKKGFFKGFFS
jgi:phage-related protein (TIGR01555 family)